MVEMSNTEKTEEEKKVIEEARKSSGKWSGEEKMEDVVRPEPPTRTHMMNAPEKEMKVEVLS